MSTEITPLLIPVQAQIDGALWQAYEPVSDTAINPSDAFLPSKEIVAAEKARFYASEGQENPDLRPRNVDTDAVAASEQTAQELKSRLKEAPVDEDVRQVYRWRINEHLANARMVQAAAAGDMRRFDGYNSFVYGAPDRDIYEAVVDHYQKFALDSLRTLPAHLASHAERVLERFDGVTGDRSLLQPSDEVFQALKASEFSELGYFTLALAGVEVPQGKIAAAVGDPILRQVGRNMGVPELELRDAPGATWSMHARAGYMSRPAGYDAVRNRFLGLSVGHEPSHLLEYQNGKRSPLALLQSGLDRYEVGNEGRAVIREQIVYPDFAAFAKGQRWQMILRRFLGTALALGYDERTPADFAGVHQTINAIDALYEAAKNPDTVEAAKAKADSRSWSLLESIYKGTDGTKPYRRYAIYLAGNVACWQAIGQDMGLMHSGDMGKYDITNQRHMPFLQRRGIVPVHTQKEIDDEN